MNVHVAQGQLLAALVQGKLVASSGRCAPQQRGQPDRPVAHAGQEHVSGVLYDAPLGHWAGLEGDGRR